MYKRIFILLTMCFILIFSANAYATGETPSSPPVTQPSSQTTTPDISKTATPTGPLSGLAADSHGMRPIEPLDLDVMGDKAVGFGNKSFAFLQKGSVPLFVWGIGGSVFMMFLGIIFGRKTVMAGVTGVIISIVVLVIIHYMPEIALSVKDAAGNAIGH